MPGYEDLTSDQIMTIVHLLTASLIIYSIAIIIRSVLLYKATKKLEGRIEKIIVDVNSIGSKNFKQLWKDMKSKREQKKLKKENDIIAGL